MKSRDIVVSVISVLPRIAIILPETLMVITDRCHRQISILLFAVTRSYHSSSQIDSIVRVDRVRLLILSQGLASLPAIVGHFNYNQNPKCIFMREP